MTGLWTIIAAVVSFAIAGLMGIWLIPLLKKIHFGQTIREEGPKWHNSKQGTPIMGGFMFIAASVVAGVVCVLLYHAFGVKETSLMSAKIFAGMFMALAFGAIGFIDDYIKAVKKRNLGLTAVQKLVLQFIVAIAYLVTIALFGGRTETFIPFYGMLDIGIFYYPLSAILIVGVVNAANLTDGIVCHIQKLLGPPRQQTAWLRKFNILRPTFEQLGTQFLFQQLHLRPRSLWAIPVHCI